MLWMRVATLFLAAVLAGAMVTAVAPGPLRGLAVDTPTCQDCNVVVVQVDLLRPDHMGLYGYDRQTTPRLDRLAEESYVFDRNLAQAPHTAPATGALMTGTYTSRHRMVTWQEMTPERRRAVRTLAEVLNDHGYSTVGSVSSIIRDELGFDQGFDRFGAHQLAHVVPTAEGSLMQPADLNDIIRRSRSTGDPFYAYMETLKLHNPYFAGPAYEHLFVPNRTAPNFEEWLLQQKQTELENLSGENVALENMSAEERAVLNDRAVSDLYWSRIRANETLRRYAIAQYDANIRYIDDRLAALFDTLKERGVWNDTVIVVTAGHGESLGDHGRWAHGTLRNEVIWTPLMVRVPGRDGGRIDAYTGNIDVAPTILDILGIDDPGFREQASGVSLAPLMAGQEPDDRYILAENKNGATALVETRTGLKFFNAPAADGRRMYDLDTDFAEEEPFYDADAAARMKEWLLGYYRDIPQEGQEVVESTWPYYG